MCKPSPYGQTGKASGGHEVQYTQAHEDSIAAQPTCLHSPKEAGACDRMMEEFKAPYTALPWKNGEQPHLHTPKEKGNGRSCMVLLALRRG